MNACRPTSEYYVVPKIGRNCQPVFVDEGGTIPPGAVQEESAEKNGKRAKQT